MTSNLKDGKNVDDTTEKKEADAALAEMYDDMGIPEELQDEDWGDR